MAIEPTNIVAQLLKRIQEDIAASRKVSETQFSKVKAGLDRLETLVRKQRRDIAGVMVIMNAAGDFDARVSVLEERTQTLEKHAI